MKSSDGYRVQLEGEGVMIERQVSDEIGQRIALLILAGVSDTKAAASHPTQVSTLAGDVQPEQQSPRVRMSAREFLEQYEPKRGPDKVATLASYLKEHDNKPVVTTGDIRKAFEDAAEPIPSNLPRDIKWAVSAGWLAPSTEQKGSYYVTRSGDEAVTKKFPRELVKKTKLSQAPRRSGKKTKKTGDKS